jgi:UDP-N-acetylmuramoyl-L-alanyl-D-glutamate--2,6-diaminopimelate ligase
MTVIGVTGTDGKTTTSNLIFQILKAAGKQAGMVSTVNAVVGDEILDTGFHVTTPESPDIQRYLALMAAAGIEVAIIEATSHGLAQQRVAACDFDIAVVTNITHEHLDYHGSYEVYRAAKAILFEAVKEAPVKAFQPVRGAVLNRDDSSFDLLSGVLSGAEGIRVTDYGVHPSAEVRADAVRHLPGGMLFEAFGKGFQAAFQANLVGTFNLSNCLAAIAATVQVLGLPVEAAQAGIAALKGVPGRMERLDLGQPFTAIVDFAHTPNALRRALEAARAIASSPRNGGGGEAGRVIAVFGSAGLRDRLKRRMMAETSAELADLTVLTAEDPRTESLDAILAEMAAGAEAKGGVEGVNFWRVPDRREALRFALHLCRPGDVLITCGKGHEQSMCFGETEYAWDDRTALRAALAEYLGVPGPEMPVLPTVG